VFVGTILVVIMLAVLPLLTPWFIHAALDAADSAARLGIERTAAQDLSDRSVSELVAGPGTFDLVSPDGTAFYDEDERSHLRDARTLLWTLLIAGGLSLLLIGAIHARSGPQGRSDVWRTISRAGMTTALVVVVLGAVSLLAFGTVFTVFHEVFFPGGNFTFDPATQRLVQLYPFRFWQIAAAAFAVLVLLLAAAAWLLGRRGARTPAPMEQP
jgi:integral membrane protein (TIGR01906 family)